MWSMSTLTAPSLMRQFLDAPAVAYRSPELDSAESDGPSARLSIHDATTLEWSARLPLLPQESLSYRLDVELEMPANVVPQTSQWGQLRSFTRLDMQVEHVSPEDTTIDSLRRHGAAVASKLAWSSTGFARHCDRARSSEVESRHEDVAATLVLWLDVAIRRAHDARDRFVRLDADLKASESDHVRHERRLVDEFISIQLMRMLTGAASALRETMLSEAGSRTLGESPVTVEERIADALDDEVRYQRERGYVWANPGSSQRALEQYTQRASALKKHFQRILFLEPETFQVADRLHNWVSAFVALVASTWACAWQIALARHPGTTSVQVGSGLVMLFVVAGLVYVAKDRIKEMGRTWIAGSVHRHYAQRVARYRAPSHMLPGRDIVVTARESFDSAIVAGPDPLNPDVGATAPIGIVRFVHKGRVRAHPELGTTGARHVKHVFRYDLTPIFARLHDAVKMLAVVDAETHRVHFKEAPRHYRLPLRLRLVNSAGAQEHAATLVISKTGLLRIERQG